MLIWENTFHTTNRKDACIVKRGFTHYYYLISCPSDVQEELEIILKTIDEINMTVGEENGVNIKCLYWKNSSNPDSGDSGQNIINKQLLSKADGVIALFWTKFGTPTEQYGSGTEEEIEKAILQGKNVMLYFSNKPIKPNMINHEQYSRVLDFKERYSGLFAEYGSLDEFRQTLNRNILSVITKLIERETAVSQNIIIQNFTLSEIMECGWFIRRFLLELPVNQESIPEFQGRMDRVIEFAQRYELLSSDDLDILISTKIRAGKKGAYTLGKYDIEMSRSIFDNIEISLMKKLKGRENASFQIGRCLGHILMLTELIWSNNHESLTSDFMLEYESAFYDHINRAKISAAILNKDIEAIISTIDHTYSNTENSCEIAMETVRVSAEKIITILPLISDT